jgi:polysaccharide chain length determinant protein (PEP-CTERM system associated)
MRAKAPLESVIRKMRKDIGVGSPSERLFRSRGTTAFTVSYRGNDSEQVAAVTNALASLFVEENLKVREEQASGTSNFLKTQLEEMRRELEETERRVGVFKSQHVGELPHQQEANLTSLTHLNTRLQMNRDQQIRVSARLSDLESLLSAELTEVVGGPNATAVRITELRQELRELREQYNDKYPDVIRVENEIASLVEQLNEYQSSSTEEQTAVLGNSRAAMIRRDISEARAELKTAQAEAELIQSDIATYQGRVDRAPLVEQQYQILIRDYETNNELYRSLLNRQKEADLAENMEHRQKGEQFRIIEPAISSEIPAAPNRPLLLVLALVLSLGLAAGLVVLLEQIDSSFNTIEDLRSSVSLPVLASIPPIVTEKDRRRNRIKFCFAVLSSIAGLVLVGRVAYFIAAGNYGLTSLLLR